MCNSSPGSIIPSSCPLTALQVFTVNIHIRFQNPPPWWRKDLKYTWLQSDVLDSQAWNFESIVTAAGTTTASFLRIVQTVKVGRDFWLSSSPATAFEAGSARAGCPRQYPARFRVCPRKKSPQQKFLLSVCMKLLFHCLMSSQWARWAKPCLSFLSPSIYMHWQDGPWAFFTRQSQLSWPHIHHLHGPLLDLFQYVHLTSAEQRGRMKAHLPWPAADALPKAAQDPVGVLNK